ncbi:hypothetical protein [Ruminiclostridium papyrosolvens]|uniref:Uncharacterized protein n=1 Tax=Ruminiclostridium papyrosolvens C7 TaxID=1330534 RepID=U4R2H8_9FIRM|nr:hypothetical protein [Ruminiclostridium papyrosolvens]EPR12507.1 hypothetical protein L323_08120 [Ruminiclostridium papyrosolvens C7]
MSTKTSNYNLTKPENSDYYDVTVHSDNYEIIDTELKNANERCEGKIAKSLATAANQFLVSTAAGAWVIKTIAEIKVLLGLGSAAYTDSTAYTSKTEFSAHQSDYTNHVPHLGITSNVDNAYSITSSKNISEGSKFTVKFNAAATDTATLNISYDNTPRRLIKPGGAGFKPKAGTYSFIRDGENFQYLGEGGEYGTDNPNDVKAGVPFGTENGIMIGTNTNNMKIVIGTIPDFQSPTTTSALSLTGTINNLSFSPQIVMFTFKDSWYSYFQQTVSSIYPAMLPAGMDIIKSGTAYLPLCVNSASDFLSNGFKYYSAGQGTQKLTFSQVKYAAIGFGD